MRLFSFAHTMPFRALVHALSQPSHLPRRVTTAAILRRGGSLVLLAGFCSFVLSETATPRTLVLSGGQLKFLGLILFVLLLLCAVVLSRYQGAQQRTRDQLCQRIAADLHDDLGTNLSRIAMLSEVIQQRLQTDDPEVQERLLRVAAISRESVESLSDIVWAINPAHDQLRDLTQRMRRVADDLCVARDLQFEFHCPSDSLNTTLSTDTRRELLLIYKECLNNIARHARCSRIEVEIRRLQEDLYLRISDNGSGFIPAHSSCGNGLRSMQVRAQRLGGNVHISSTLQQGTVFLLQVPIGKKRRTKKPSRVVLNTSKNDWKTTYLCSDVTVPASLQSGSSIK